MASDFSGVSSPALKSLQYDASAPSEISKGLVQPSSGGFGQDPALVAWHEHAVAYHNAVLAGDPNTPKPTEAEWNDFLAQLQWAQTTLYGYGNAGMGGLGAVGGNFGAPQGPQSNQFGGMAGTMGNWVYTSTTSKIGFTGDGTHDIWSNDITIDVAPVSAKVTIEETHDTRSAPAEPVIKVTVTDPATGTQAVYFIHDFDPSKDKLKINTPDEGQIINDSTGYATWGEFKPGSAKDPNAKPDASIEGIEQSDGSLLYEPDFAGETVNFWANPNPEGGSQVHVVYADANISVKPSDEVDIKMVGDVVEVTVTHSDGSTDVYKVQKGYNVNVNQKVEYISENGSPVGEDGIDNEDLKKRVTLNGVTSDAVPAGAIDADAVVSSLLSASGRSEAQLLTALKSAGYSYATIEDFKAAIASGDFPGTPNTKLVTFLSILDADLKNAMLEYGQALADCKSDEEKKGVLETANNALIELLTILYPHSIVSKGTTNQERGSFSLNGEDYTWTTDGSSINVNIE